MEDKKAILDELLQEKHERERLASWKTKIPMPELENNITSSNSIKKLLIFGISLVMILLSLLSYYYINEKSNKLVDRFIATTPIASLEEQNHRGQNQPNNESTQLPLKAQQFNAAIKELKSGKDLVLAISLLETLSASKNKYQVDALWWKALAHAKANENAAAIHELEKLKAISNYQKENIKKLLEELK